MNVENRFGKRLAVRDGNHQLCRRNPIIRVLPADVGSVDASGEGFAENLGQSRNRKHYMQRIAMNKYNPGIGINLVQRIQRKDMVRAFQHPARTMPRLVLQMLQEALVETVGIDLAHLREPTAVTRY